MTVVNVTPPVVSGSAQQGQTLSTTDGTWTYDDDYIEFAYRWLRCDAVGANCVPISGAVYPSFSLSAADVGSTLRSEVTGTEVPAPPPPTGDVYDASPGQAVSVINGASAGDTVRLLAGTHPQLTLPKSFAEPRLTVTCEAGATVQGIHTNGQDGYIFDDIHSQRAVQFSNYNDSAFYLHGTSTRIKLIRSTLIGGGITLKVYCGGGLWAEDLDIIDCDISGGGMDLSHWDGARGFRIDHNYFHDPTFQSGAHQDGIQMVRARDFTVSRNRFRAPGISGGQSQGMMIGSTVQYGESRSIINGDFVNNLVAQWNENKPLLLTCCDNVNVVNNTFQDHGSEYYSITVVPDHGPVSNVDIWNNIVQWVYSGVGGGVSFFDTNWHTRSGGTHGANEQTGSPGFAETTEFTLSGGAAARDYGLTRAGTPTVDRDGTTRPTPRGLGCQT